MGANQLLVEGYAVERQLGFGGMGEVYLVKDAATGRRFAVKMSQFADDDAERQFLEELLVWIDLPPDPHIAQCHFFRTAGDRIAIFAEFVEGGSLADWVADGEITRFGQVLDLGIMSARGLARIHSWGFLHQDVKPANILVGVDGIARVSDFGLARAAMKARLDETPARNNSRISTRGMTLAYRSPEQAARRPLTAATDVWSWGLTMLELFTGEVTWLDGQVAADVLASVVAMDSRALRIELPSAMSSILERCFRQNPANRWATMNDVEEALLRVFRDSQQRVYPRKPPPNLTTSVASIAQGIPAEQREVRDGVSVPQAWLRKARFEAGLGERNVRKMPATRLFSRGRDIASLAVFEEASQILERRVSDGHIEVTTLLGGLYLEKGALHERLDDDPGALRLYDRAIDSFNEFVSEETSTEGLALALQAKTTSLIRLGRWYEALQCVSRATGLAESLGRPDLSIPMVLLKAQIAFVDDDLKKAVEFQSVAISAAERWVVQECHSGGRHLLAAAYSAKAVTLHRIGNRSAAVECCDRALEHFKPLIVDPEQFRQSSVLPLYTRGIYTEDERRQLATVDFGSLVSGYLSSLINKAHILTELGDASASMLHAEAIAVLEQLTANGRGSEYRRFLATAYGNAANLARTDNLEQALRFHDRAIAIYEQLYYREGQRLLGEALAVAWLDKATTLMHVGKVAAGQDLNERAIDFLEYLVESGVKRLRHTLCKAYVNMATAAVHFRPQSSETRHFDDAIALYQHLIAEGEAGDVVADWAWARGIRGYYYFHHSSERQLGRSEIDAALEILESELLRSDRIEIRAMIAWLRKT